VHIRRAHKPLKPEVNSERPLSSLLFNRCREPLLKAGIMHFERFGSYVGPAKGRIGFAVQAYVENVILISREPEGIQKMRQGP
jgi:hypothetical protein